MKAFLKNYRQSPRKVRLVTDLIKSKRVADAIVILDNLPKRASLPIKKLLVSAISNAKNGGMNEENLFIESVTVNKGIVLKRSMPRAHGSASRINKRTSHVLFNITEKVMNNKVKSNKSPKAEVKAEVKAKEGKEDKKKVVKSKTVTKKSAENKAESKE